LERNTWKEAQVAELEHITREHVEGGTSVRTDNTGILSVLGVKSAHNHETHTAQFSIAQISNYTYLIEFLSF